MSAAKLRNPPEIKLTLYVYLSSQPARAILGFCQLNGIEYDMNIIDIFKGGHMTADFAKVNPAK